MKKTRWVNFVWDLAGNKLPAITTPRQYRLSLVKAAEREQLQGVIEKSFALDPGWNAALHMIDAQVKSSIAAAFDSESANWLALQHGARIVGGTLLLMTDPDAPAQLVPGPCILMEYRNRGLVLCCSAPRYAICEMPGWSGPAPKPERTHQLRAFCIRNSAANPP